MDASLQVPVDGFRFDNGSESCCKPRNNLDSGTSRFPCLNESESQNLSSTESTESQNPSPTESTVCSEYHPVLKYIDDMLMEEDLEGEFRMLAPQAPNRKFKRNEQQQAAHRRIRRPFSITEVESLVQAVEKLGTGRWRDVKVRAFEDAEHRTCVDLKDKWKTLVHTAMISPQQRRGEPVPQVLLDRVLKAHAYWSQHQMHQLKTEPPRFQAEALI